MRWRRRLRPLRPALAPKHTHTHTTSPSLPPSSRTCASRRRHWLWVTSQRRAESCSFRPFRDLDGISLSCGVALVILLRKSVVDGKGSDDKSAFPCPAQCE